MDDVGKYELRMKKFVIKSSSIVIFFFTFSYIMKNKLNKLWEYKMVEINLHSNYDSSKCHIIFQWNANNGAYRCCPLEFF